VAPGASLYAVRVLNNAGSGSWSSVICGVDWVTANAPAKGIRVANMSLGGSGSDGSCTSDALHQAICGSINAGITYFVAAGNSASDLGGFVPAAYDQVLTVTAIADFNGQPGGGAAAACSDVDDSMADFSNFTRADSSDQGHTIAAPGVCIESAWKRAGYNTISARAWPRRTWPAWPRCASRAAPAGSGRRRSGRSCSAMPRHHSCRRTASRATHGIPSATGRESFTTAI
jgi:subtilisin